MGIQIIKSETAHKESKAGQQSEVIEDAKILDEDETIQQFNMWATTRYWDLRIWI